MRNTLGLLVLLVAYGLLWPGLTLPVLTLQGTIERADVAEIGKDILTENPNTPQIVLQVADYLLENMDISGQEDVYQRTRSILGAIRELHQNGFFVVAFLVALFSIVIPVAKGLMLLFSCLPGLPRLSMFLRGTADLVSRWSMADVFVVGLFVAFLAANAVRREEGLLSFEATLDAGFYCFLGYCLLSILSSQILNRKSERVSG